MAPPDEESRASFERTCLPFTRTLYSVAVRLTHRPEDASDVVQETFLRAYRTYASFRPGTNARAWLLRILHSVFVNRCRKQHKTPDWVPLDEAEEHLPRTTAFAGAPTASELEAALAALPAPYRAAILLVDVEGLTYEEAAAALECPLGTLRSRLHRARALMLEALLPPRSPSLPGRLERQS